jgi:hypothetical protein
VTVRDDGDWSSVGECLGQPAWAINPVCATAARRVEGGHELDDHLAPVATDGER